MKYSNQQILQLSIKKLRTQIVLPPVPQMVVKHIDVHTNLREEFHDALRSLAHINGNTRKIVPLKQVDANDTLRLYAQTKLNLDKIEKLEIKKNQLVQFKLEQQSNCTNNCTDRLQSTKSSQAQNQFKQSQMNKQQQSHVSNVQKNNKVHQSHDNNKKQNTKLKDIQTNKQKKKLLKTSLKTLITNGFYQIIKQQAFEQILCQQIILVDSIKTSQYHVFQYVNDSQKTKLTPNRKIHMQPIKTDSLILSSLQNNEQLESIKSKLCDDMADLVESESQSSQRNQLIDI